jgi:hypothetical protein
MINHADKTDVRMIFVPLPSDFPSEILCLVPSVNARNMTPKRRWAVAVVALEDLDASEGSRELFFDYGQNPETLGWSGPAK